MNFILRISSEIKKGESGVTGSIIAGLSSLDIQADEMVGESGFTRIIINDFHS